ncbi:sushi, von Willebrand factor type A, EGF and pentraxin domain-containing protein 1-like isoform X2 [Clavelina lepadiformis]|uniref:sushi, von Willebrand factor type A, EGF and pentraxin domain-containing protein 1-like isoform X2 n=1 Tax=Clavelina lepadiformis TaxID=159417 RepID=UPI0040422EA0
MYLFYILLISLAKAQELQNGSPFPASSIPLDRIPPNPFPLDLIPAEPFSFFPVPPPRIQPVLPIDFAPIAFPSADCFPPPPGPNSELSFDVNSSVIPVKTKVKYECHPGFSATGPTQFSCQNGSWDIELFIPNCTIPDSGCGNPPFLLDGDIVGDPPYDINETISYRCLEGFECINPNASSISRCEPGNQWSLQTHDENFPTCFPVCSVPPSPPEDVLLLSSENIFNRDTFPLGTEVIYGCEDPFSKHVQNTFTCTTSGWLGGFPFCPLHCDNPPSTTNASIFPISTREFSQARFFCDPGLFTSNATLIYCIGGEWKIAPERFHSFEPQGNLTLPICIEPSEGCGNPPLLINGAYEAVSEPNQVHYIHETITYFCISGYYLNAPAGSKSTCLAGNRWSLNESASSFPICEPDCGNPPQATNATVRVFSTIEGSIAHYICDEGLSTNDVTTSTCRRNGNVVSWDLVQLPLCRIPENGCGNPPMINNGFAVSIPPYKEGNIVTYDCFQGYELVAPGGSYVVCRQNEWINELESPMLPFCRRVCLSLPTLPRGGVVLVDETLRNKDGISFSNGVEHGFGCQPGYRLVRDATLTCVEGDWYWRVNRKSAEPPLCYRDCGPPPKVANATVDALATVETWAVDYVCNPGLSTSPSKTIVCDSNGKWVSRAQEAESFPTCTLPSSGCGDPPVLKNGWFFFVGPHYNDTVTYRCDFGYEISAPNGAMSTCLPENTWSLTPGSEIFPICNSGCVQSPPEATYGLEIVDEPFRYTFGFGFGSIVTYRCKEGSTLIGSTTLNCSNGMWLPDLPTCVQNCSTPPRVQNAQIRRALNSESQSFEYMCDPGFSTTDFTITICLDDGTWSLNRLPRCTAPKQGCGSPASLQNGKYSGEAPFAEGASIKYQCKDDLRMVAPNGAVSTCQAGNKWSLELNRGNFPECRLDCKTAPPRPNNDVLILNEPVPDNDGFYAKGSAIVYGCDFSGSLTGSPVSICLGNGWFPDILDLRCVYASFSLFIPDTYVFYGPRRRLDVAKTNDFIQPNFSISTNMTNYTAASRTNGSDLIPITSVCGYPGFCVGSPPDIYFKCSNHTLFECEACGVGRAVSFLFFVLLFALTIFFGNALVIWVGYKRFNRKKANKMDICKLSLAVADILTGIQILVVVSFNFTWTMNSTPVELIQQQSALQGSPQAYVGGIFFLFTLTSSLFHLVYMGGERLYAIAKPIRYKWQKKTSVYVGLGAVWILSFLSATVPAWFPTQLHFTYLAPTFLYQPAITSTVSNMDYSVAITFMIIFYLLPFMLLTASCLFTAFFVYAAGNQRSNNTGTKQSQSSNKRRNKRKLTVLKTIAIMQIGFTATLLPIVVAASLFYSGHLDCDDIAQPYMVCFYFSMTNSLVNFIVYSARERDFRNEMVDIFKPGYLKQLSVQSTAQKPRKDENSSKNVDSSENVIETSKTPQTKQTSTSF